MCDNVCTQWDLNDVSTRREEWWEEVVLGFVNRSLEFDHQPLSPWQVPNLRCFLQLSSLRCALVAESFVSSGAFPPILQSPTRRAFSHPASLCFISVWEVRQNCTGWKGFTPKTTTNWSTRSLRVIITKHCGFSSRFDFEGPSATICIAWDMRQVHCRPSQQGQGAFYPEAASKHQHMCMSPFSMLIRHYSHISADNATSIIQVPILYE